MPTNERDLEFIRDWHRLTPEQRRLFLAMLPHFVDDLRICRFRKALRVKKYWGRPGWFEMSWAPDGRALFTYGPEVIPGEVHIVWKRIGGHAIFDRS